MTAMTQEVLPVEVLDVSSVKVPVSAFAVDRGSFGASEYGVIDDLYDSMEDAATITVQDGPVLESRTVDIPLSEAQRGIAVAKAADALGSCAVSIFDIDHVSERHVFTGQPKPEVRYKVRLTGEYMRSQQEVHRALGDQATQRDHINAYKEYVAIPTEVEAPIDQAQEPEQAAMFDAAGYREQVAKALKLQPQQVRPLFEKLLSSAEAGETLTRLMLGFTVGGDRSTGHELLATLNAFTDENVTDENAAGERRVRIKLLTEGQGGALEVTGSEHVRSILSALPVEAVDIEDEAEVAVPEPVTVEPTKIPLGIISAPTVEPLPEPTIEPVGAEKQYSLAEQEAFALAKLAETRRKHRHARPVTPYSDLQKAYVQLVRGESPRGHMDIIDGDVNVVVDMDKHSVKVISRTAAGEESTNYLTRQKLLELYTYRLQVEGKSVPVVQTRKSRRR